MVAGNGLSSWEVQAKKIAALLFPGQDPTDRVVEDTLGYLEDCIHRNAVGERFFRIFYRIPRDSVQLAIDQGKTISEIVTRCAELQSKELGDRGFHETARGVNRISKADGQRHRGGAGVRAS